MENKRPDYSVIEEIIRKSKSLDDAFKETVLYGEVAPDVSNHFYANYGDEGKIPMKDAFKRLYDEIKDKDTRD